METTFTGKFVLDRPLAPEHKDALLEFWEEEHQDEDGRPGGPGMPNSRNCQWMPTEDGGGLEWDGYEKFRRYAEWLEYLIRHFLKPWGYTLNGTVQWVSIFEPERGTLVVQNNTVAAVPDLEKRKQD